MSDPAQSGDNPPTPPTTPSGGIPGYYGAAMLGMSMPIFILIAGPILKPIIGDDEAARAKLPWIFCLIVLAGAWLSARGLIGAIRANDSKARLRGAVGLAANLLWLGMILFNTLLAPN